MLANTIIKTCIVEYYEPTNIFNIQYLNSARILYSISSVKFVTYEQSYIYNTVIYHF